MHSMLQEWSRGAVKTSKKKKKKAVQYQDDIMTESEVRMHTHIAGGLHVKLVNFLKPHAS